MKVLHIATNYSINKLYSYLCQGLDDLDIKQDVYVPIKTIHHIDSNKFESNNVEIYYSDILKKSDRYMYKHKIQKQFFDISNYNKFNLNEIDLIHAHTWYSDGGTAYYLNKKYGIPYIVSIRNTDVNLFYKYYLHHRKLGLDIIKNAEKIIFISESYKRKVTKLLSNVYEIKHKSIVIPNGIHKDWFETNNNKSEKDEKVFKLLFIGKLNKSKNLKNVIKACEYLDFEYKLDVVGEGKLFKELDELARKKNINIEFHGYISSKNEIKNLMEKSDLFVLASHFETFGISYIEALSQGLPIIYTRGQGVDNMFDSTVNVGEKVNSKSPTDIAEKITLIRENYETYDKQGMNELDKFSWENISKQYLQIYSDVPE